MENNSNQALAGNGGGPRWKDVNALSRLVRFIRIHLLASSVYTVATALIIYACQQYWSESYQQSIYKSRHQLRETKIYQNLIDGPSFHDPKGAVIPRKASQDESEDVIIPKSKGGNYSLVIGQHGVGRTTLVKMTTNALPSPKGIIYIDILMDETQPLHFMSALQKAIGWSEDPIVDASKRMSSSFTVIVFRANSLAAVCLPDVWEAFYAAAAKFKKEFGVVPVVIIDSANRLSRELLESLLNHA